MRFVIYTDPSPKERPRFNPFSKRTYTPKKTADFENKIREEICHTLGRFFDYPMHPLADILAVDLDFVFARPKTMQFKRYEDGLLWRPKSPDIDNLQKIIYDSLNGILWQDDRQIVDGRNRKFVAEKKGEPRICMHVYPAGDPPVATCDFPNSAILDKLAGRVRHEDD